MAVDPFFGQNRGNLLLRWIRRILILAGAALATLLYFLILPLLESIGNPPDNELEIRSVAVAEEPPPPPPEMEEPEEPEEKDKPKLAEPSEPLDLSQLEIALNPSGGGGLAGDFAVQLDTRIDRAQGMNAVFSMDQLDQRPRVIYQPSPRYPPQLQRRGIEGRVYIVFVVDGRGRVTNAKIQQSSHKAFEKPALQAVRKWKFEPGKRNGEPVQFRMRVPITFSAG